MAIPAHWEDRAEPGQAPREPRRKLCLEARGALPSGASAEILVHDISVTGLLVESPVALAIDERIAIELPEAGETWARVVWDSGKLFGCRFDAPISAAALSAAQLRSAVDQPVDLAARRASGSFGARLQQLRLVAGVSQAHIAGRLGVSKPTVWAWEHDRARPIGSRLDDLAEALGVTREDLLTAPVPVLGVPGDPTGGDLVARSREAIATAFGVGLDRVRISIEL